MPKANTNGPEMRTTDGGDQVSVELLRSYLTWVLRHDVVSDKINDVIFDHAADGHLHPTVAAVLLRELVYGTIDAATNEDWLGVFEMLVDEAREAIPELELVPAPDPFRIQRLKGALRAARRWWVRRA